MKKIITMMFTLLLTVAVAFTQASQASQDGEMMKKSKSAKSAAPASDTDIQKCISDKFATSKSVTNGAATVSNGEATLTGEAKNAGGKGGASKTAKSCGAKKVVNNITTPQAAPAAAKTAEKKK